MLSILQRVSINAISKDVIKLKVDSLFSHRHGQEALPPVGQKRRLLEGGVVHVQRPVRLGARTTRDAMHVAANKGCRQALGSLVSMLGSAFKMVAPLLPLLGSQSARRTAV